MWLNVTLNITLSINISAWVMSDGFLLAMMTKTPMILSYMFCFDWEPHSSRSYRQTKLLFSTSTTFQWNLWVLHSAPHLNASLLLSLHTQCGKETKHKLAVNEGSVSRLTRNSHSEQRGASYANNDQTIPYSPKPLPPPVLPTTPKTRNYRFDQKDVKIWIRLSDSVLRC